MRIDDQTLERARSARSLVGLVGARVKLRRAGRGWSGLCPFHSEKTPSFTVSDSRGFYHCFGCGAHGSAIDWIMETQGLAFRDAVEFLLGEAVASGEAPIAKRQRQAEPVEIVASMTAGRWIWQTAQSAESTIVAAWLASRGLDPASSFDGAEPAIARLRFHPRCPLGAWRIDQDPARVQRHAPAMVAPIADADGAIWGVHVTYLSADGRAKAEVNSARKMFGKVAGHAVWLTATNGDLPLVVGEGIETCWAFAERHPHRARVAATLSLENLQGGAKRLRNGALPTWHPESDPERPPFLVRGAAQVSLLIDADMKPLRQQKVQLAKGAKSMIADIGGLQRAELCASLAAQAWRRAGARQVRCFRPRMGWDFNDAARAA